MNGRDRRTGSLLALLAGLGLLGLWAFSGRRRAMSFPPVGPALLGKSQQSYDQLILTRAPLVYYSAQQSGEPLLDLSGNGFHVAGSDMVFGLAGPGGGKAVRYLNPRSRQPISADARFRLTGSKHSQEIWIYWNGETSWRDYGGCGYPGVSGSGWSLKANGYVGWYFRFGNGELYPPPIIQGAGDVNVWTQIGYSFDTDTVRFYKNGQLVDTRAGRTPLVATADPFGLGPHASGGTQQTPFSRWARWSICHDKALTGAEFAASYAAGIAGP